MSHGVNDEGEEVASLTNVQSADNCILMGMALAKESKRLLTDHYADFFAFANGLAENGLAARDGEPSLKPFKSCGSADMSYQQKLTALGGPCKSIRFFCHCCKSNSKVDYNLFHRVDGDERCSICIRNESEFCCHRAVNAATRKLSKRQTGYTTL
jgi:hypothetical protein